MAVLLYAYAFYQPTEGWEGLYRWVDWIDQLPLRVWFVVEIVFLVINIVSVTLHLRKYGALALDDICGDNEVLRRRILAVVPNSLTLLNGVMGITAVVFASHGRVREAVFVLMGAAFFDRLDGLMARRLGLTTPPERARARINTGALLDDISDAISFALAPALMFYFVMTELQGAPLGAAAVYGAAALYAAAGVSRLLYFTLDKSPVPGFFKGMPVPAAALMVSATMEIVHQAQSWSPALAELAARGSVAAMVLAAAVMNLFPVRYLHVGRLLSRRPGLLWGSALIWLALVFTPFFGVALLAVCLVYLVSPVFTGRIDPAHAEMEHRLQRSHP